MRVRSGGLIPGLRMGAGLCTVLLVGCGTSDGGSVDSDAALRDSLGLSSRVELHRVWIGGSRDVDSVSPVETRAEPGDVVLFESVDGRVHMLGFETDSLSSDSRAFLDETRQLDEFALLRRGDRLLVDLADAPDGRYVFRARSAGPSVFGTVVIGPPGN